MRRRFDRRVEAVVEDVLLESLRGKPFEVELPRKDVC